MHAIILAGGFGTRLRSVVSDVPKPLAPIAGRPFLAWLVDSLAGQGFTSITLSVHYDWEKIRDYFTANPAPVALDYAVENQPLGTGGAILYALPSKPNALSVVINGDTYVQLDYRALYEQHRTSGAALTMALRRVDDTGRYGEVAVEGGVITEFRPGSAGQQGLINAGVYVLSRRLFAGHDLPEAFSFERDFLPPHVGAIQPRAYLADEYFIDIGIPEDYVRAQTEIPERIAGRSAA